MKRLLACIMTFALAATMLVACDNNSNGQQSATESKPKIIAATFPEYDWTRQVLGDRIDEFELILLVENGVDLHSFQPSVSDVAQISTCDLFIYGGGPSDEWVENALSNAKNEDMIVMNLVETLGDSVKEEELKEGMEDDHDHKPGEVHEEEIDEHVWLSLRNAQALVNVIAGHVGELDVKNDFTYASNAASYVNQLLDLNTEYQTAVSLAENNTLIFADRFPFRYLVDDYEIDYYAAFSGCSAETEASFETIIFLAEKLDELGLKQVMTIEDSDQSIAKTVVQNTTDKDQQILVLDSMQSITSAEINAGTTYLSIMENNLEVLKQALN